MPSKEELAELWLHAQPGRLSAKEQLRAMAHETAIACFKRNLAAASPAGDPWKETHQQFQARVASVVKEANKRCNFRLLCCEYLTRLETLVQQKGGRLKK